MYVCGPTVYGEPHLGHARPAIIFDILFRYLKCLGYKVRYVRNITDVGHLLNDADEGGDKIGEKAKALQLEPMEVAHFYTKKYFTSQKQFSYKGEIPPCLKCGSCMSSSMTRKVRSGELADRWHGKRTPQ